MKTPPFDINTYPYSVCREQHHWQPYDGAIDDETKLAYRVQRCQNCPTMKHSVISMRPTTYGQLVRTHYAYPQDYRVQGGISLADRGKLRVRNFLAELEKAKKKKT